jgi:alanine-alpha-ketoisovalerate/valine-pyruvate aminotransferase
MPSKNGGITAILRPNMDFIPRILTLHRGDFLLLGPRGRGKTLWSMRQYPPSCRYLLYRGKERLKRDGVLCVPCEEFLLGLKVNRFES